MKIRRTWLLFCLVGLLLSGGCRQRLAVEKPLIGITSVYKIDEKNMESAEVTVPFSYVRAVLENGGVPIVLPTVDDPAARRHYVNNLDGLILIGGDDVPPSVYGEAPHETVKIISQPRYRFESKLIPLWWQTGKPLLGVCLGMQFTNVAQGGSLIQDIPTQVGETVNHRCKGDLHPVTIVPGSLLHAVLRSEKAWVYSSHHQAVKEVGRDLKVIARSPDGVIEALERVDGGFGLFVQWHPEAMADAGHRRAIYGALVRACQKGE